MRERLTLSMETSLVSATSSPNTLIQYREIDFVRARGKYAMNLISWLDRSRSIGLTGNDCRDFVVDPLDGPYASRADKYSARH